MSDAQEIADRITLQNAIERVRDYVSIRDEYPMRELGDVVHAVHLTTDWEAEIRLSDLRLILAAWDKRHDGDTER